MVWSRVLSISLLLSIVIGVPLSGRQSGDVYEVGVGIGDVTGPSVGISLMGYANPGQTAKGIHTRLFARTFIIKSGKESIVYSSIDIGMLDTSIKREVVTRLNKEFGSVYDIRNVLLTATHTHSAPGGYIQYAMYGIASLGFHKQNFEAIVDGIVDSIRQAHHSIQPGYLSFIRGDLFDSSINRSPIAYEANPESERNRYKTNVDTEMTLLRIDAVDGTPLGMFNWFAVHPTSMNNTNRLLSGDNKGYASMLFEYKMNPGQRPGKGKFVSAFASSNHGDISPNTEGAKCRGGPDEGKNCDMLTSVCGNTVMHCIAFGPGKNGHMEESTEIIGRRQFDKAWELYNSKDTDFIPIRGKIQFAHQNINMSRFEFPGIDENGNSRNLRTCPAAMGYSFAAGTTDGPGLFLFTQGDTTDDPFWNTIRNFLRKPTPEQEACHLPKPILLDVGETHLPYDWAPSVVDTQILRLGNLFIAGVPGEFTTMSGRRMKKGIKEKAMQVRKPGEPEPHVVIGGMSNLYTHYITTYEEYGVQRYEGASTIYGPHTLQAYLYQYKYLTEMMIREETIQAGPEPPNFMSMQISLLTPIIVDLPPFGWSFGQAKLEPRDIYLPGQYLRTVFVSGHPRNNPLRGGSFFLVERQRENGSGWDVIATDGDWNTKFQWKRPIPIISLDSEIEFIWDIPVDAQIGVYRIRHFGYYKPYMQKPKTYEGSTRTFQVRKSYDIKSGYLKERTESVLVKLWKKLLRK